ncbi:MAG: Bacitracin transport permease protein BCRC [Parcubacteria group bacterium Gr01-1014_19]|nr:MAG: Bacitracin transport permease protein BCRC [Parcubacteria group bacterium Gr01-1014_19]
MGYDLAIFNFFHSFAGQSVSMDWLILFFGKYLAYILILGAVVLLWREKSWRHRVYKFALLALAVIVSRGLIAEAIQFFFFRARPFVQLDLTPVFNHGNVASFPSGHASLFFALAFAIFLFNRKVGSLFLLGAVLMGMARVAAGVHWPLDILVGALVGVLSALMVNLVLAKGSSKE